MSDVDLALTAALVLSPIVVGVTEAAKRSGLPSRWSALASIVIGCLVALGFGAAGWMGLSLDEWPDALLTGLVSGLVAGGLYSGAKAVVTNGNGKKVTP